MFAKLLPVFEKYLSFTHVNNKKNSFLTTQGIDGVIVGVSGGPDSMALLDILVRLKKMPRFGSLRLIVAHVNHGLRGKSSDKDEFFVRKTVDHYRKQHGDFVVFESRKISLPGKSHLEVRGRDERRKFFHELKEKYVAKWILTAHHADDNLESIFLHFLRGAGPAGLAGMQVAKDGFLRPLLAITKKEILQYCRRRKLHFRVDQTNRENAFRRNLLRNKIFPLLRKINPHFEKTLLRNAEIFHDLDIWLIEAASAFLAQQKSSQPRLNAKQTQALFHSKDFLKLPRAIQKTVLQLAFQKFTKQSYRLPSAKIDDVLRMIKRNVGKKKIQCGKHGSFSLEKGGINLEPVHYHS